VAIRQSKKKSDFGPVYKGHEGQWSWLIHRVTGVAIILFLFAHVIDTAVIGWGPNAYNRVVSVYENPVVRLLELGLVAEVLPPDKLLARAWELAEDLARRPTLLLRYTRLLLTQALRRQMHDLLGYGLGMELLALGEKPEGPA